MNFRYIKSCLFFASIASLMMASSQAADASPVHYKTTHGKHAKHPYRSGSHHRTLPRGHNVVWVSGQKYFHHNNIFYQQAANGYVVVEQPSASTTNNPMYVYPAHGQSPDQQRQDRYECHVWASNQTGFDPSNITSSTTTKVVYVEQSAPNHQHNNGIVTGAVGGAAVGALGGAIAGDAGIGAAVGAGLGAITGAVTQNHKQQKAQRVNQTTTNNTNINGDRDNYDRAITACLEARNYTVK